MAFRTSTPRSRRALVEQHAPRQDGSIFQDLGRDPVTVLVDGLLLGAAALSGLEQLRAAQLAAEPLPFAADVVIGSELTEVLIEDLQVRQVAGYPDRYRYTLRLREYKRSPGPAAALQLQIDGHVAADADAWGSDSLAAAGVLLDPASLPTALLQNPKVLDHLSATDLGKSIAVNAKQLSGANFSGMLQTVSRLDPGKAVGLIQALRDEEGLAGFLEKYADEGLDFVSDLTGVDLRRAGPLVEALVDGLEFLKRAQDVAERAGKLIGQVSGFDPLADIQSLFGQKR
jgi:hypothetical protein